MTKANSILHRAAALLAALCLLASMALPVYAAETETDFSVSNSETIPSDDNTGNGADGTGSDISVSNLETSQKDADTTNEGSKTEPEISVPESGTIPSGADTTDKAAGTPPAEGVTGSENTAPADSAAADKTAPDEEKTNLTEENTSDDEEDTADDGEDPAGEAGAKETFFAADTYSEDETESDDRSAPMTASNEGGTANFIPKTVTIYFAVDSNYQNSYWVHLYAQKKNGDSLDKDMSDTGTTITDSEKKEHKIFSVTLSQADYPGGGFDRLIFQYHGNGNTENGNTWKGQFLAFGGKDKNNKNWTTIDKIAGKMFDATTSPFDGGNATVADNPYNDSQWTRVEYYYAGMPLYFKNASTTTLDGVTATFYKKDENGNFVETGSQTIGTVAANTMAAQKITIPNNQSQFVKFTWTNSGEGTLYNFSNDACEGITMFDLAANNCFVYSGNESTESPWQNAGGDLLTKDKTIYFDATLSSYAYAKDYDIHQNPMPGSDNKMYCFFVAEGGSSTKVEMVKDSTQENSNRQLWSCKVPDGGPFTAVQFSARQDADGKSAVDDLTKQYSTAEIPPNLKALCFFADDGDPTAYTGRNGDINKNWVFRDGYWGEKDAIRNAESGKGTTVVDIANGTFTQEAGTKYITSTLYDYYTDYELNGFNRDSYPDSSINSQRWYVTFEQFDRALSSAYAVNNNVQYPIYTGHFQPSINNWSCPFADVAAGMGLYGWNSNTDTDEYKKFMAVNNSVLDTKGEVANDEAGYARTFQGLVEDKTSTGDANGLPVLKGKSGTGSLVDPHFNKEFLEGKNTFNTVLGKVYENVSFPFTKDAVFKNTDGATDDKEAKAEYWYYDSSKSSLYLTQDKDNGKFYLGSTKDDSGKLTTDIKSENRKFDNNTNGTCGFFPFNESVGAGGASQYNYGFGAKLQFDFTLTDDGKVQVGDNPNDKVPIKFFFSGDDDVWVYIDGQLVLDVGGAHGKASGLLEFGRTTDGTANTVTPYVSSNKAGGIVYKDSAEGKSVYFNGSKVTFDKKGKILVKDDKVEGGEKEFTLTKGTTHTLTMFYMERGMWESNMAVAFNFPDHNELQVEKKVDVTGVNDLFENSFQNQKIFTFNIKNLATHYVPKGTSYKEGETEKLPDNAYKNAHGSSDAPDSLTYASEPPDKKDGDLAVLWSATMDDPTSAHREQRRGTLPLDSPINIKDFSYLTFDVYVEGKKTDTCALGNLYVELLDTESHQKGCINGKGLQSSDVYGAATGLHPGQWYTIRLLLNSLQKDEGFNNQLTKITVGDNFAREIYLRNFTFRSAPKEQTKPGFTTEQYDIPDYNSATTGKLENAKYAVFSSDRGNGDVVDVVDENGQFLLQDGETVTFKDQFRRGSYIALKEQVDPNLYDTFWTVYENDAPVKEVKDVDGLVTKGSVTTLENVKDTAPDDGRTEQVIEGKDKNGDPIKNEYDNISKKPTDNTLVFRSYSGTADKDELTKLKVVFTNKVKTGKLIIRKEAAKDETLLGQTFTFTVKFSNVGGQGLGVDIPEQNYYCTVTEQANGQEYGEVEIKGIPVGTRFVVSEVAQEGTNLQSVTITGGKDCAITEDGKRVRGSVVEDDANVATATFFNTSRQLIDLEVTKQWQKQDGTTNIPNKELPAAIYLKLQRTKTPEKEDGWVDVDGYGSVMLKPWYDGWVTKFTGLDKFDVKDDPHVNYTYRVLESATADGTFYGGSAGNVIEIDGKKYKILKNTVQVQESSTTPLKLTLTNKLQDAKYNLNITKQDAQDTTKKLGGVEFKLEKLLDKGNLDTQFGENGVRVGLTAESTGLLTFDNLSPGSYRLTETKTAEGYTLLADAIEFELKTDGHCVRDGAGFGNVKYDSAAGVYNIALTINNRKSFELPHTGADAPSLWLLIGLPALVAVLLVLVFRYNKKGGRR